MVASLPARVAMRAELRKRWRTWALAAPLYWALHLGGGGAFALAAGLGLVAVSEYVRMAGLRRGEYAVLGAASVALPALAWAGPRPARPAAGALLLPAAALPALLAGDRTAGFTRSARTVFALLWIPVALTGLIALGPATAMAVGLAVALSDVGAWCGGTALGAGADAARPGPRRSSGGCSRGRCPRSRPTRPGRAYWAPPSRPPRAGARRRLLAAALGGRPGRLRPR